MTQNLIQFFMQNKRWLTLSRRIWQFTNTDNEIGESPYIKTKIYVILNVYNSLFTKLYDYSISK